MKIGYARVSTDNQTLDPQLDALKKEGCEKIFTDVGSGKRSDRPGLEEAVTSASTGDVICVVRLDRLGRSLQNLTETVTKLKEKEVGFKSLTELIDTTTSTGTLMFHMLGSIAQFERDLMRERVMEGLESARLRGRVGGRRITDQSARLNVLNAVPDETIKETCHRLDISRATYYRILKSEK